MSFKVVNSNICLNFYPGEKLFILLLTKDLFCWFQKMIYIATGFSSCLILLKLLHILGICKQEAKRMQNLIRDVFKQIKLLECFPLFWNLCIVLLSPLPSFFPIWWQHSHLLVCMLLAIGVFFSTSCLMDFKIFWYPFFKKSCSPLMVIFLISWLRLIPALV